MKTGVVSYYHPDPGKDHKDVNDDEKEEFSKIPLLSPVLFPEPEDNGCML